MSRREKGIAASVATQVLVFGVYSIIVFRMYVDGRFEGADSTALVGKAILVLVAAQIAGFVLSQIVVNVMNCAAMREDKLFASDERDKLIELREMQASFIVFLVGFFASMTTLAQGGPPVLVFNMIVLSLTLGDTVGKLRKLRLYRRGF